MTDQSITQSEFQRFQDQLISLKEGKYKTEEKCEILCRNLKQLELKCSHLERELTKANEFKNKLKGSRDIEILMDDNQVLRDRMSATESNFKLQNDILRTECERLFSENERLKCQMETYKLPSSNPNVGNINNEYDGVGQEEQRYKVRNLQFEVTKLMEEKEKSELENTGLKKLLNEGKIIEKELIIRVDSLLNDKSKLINENNKLKDDVDAVRQLHCNEMSIVFQKHAEELLAASLEYAEALDIEKKAALDKQFDLKSTYETMEKGFEERIDELQTNWRIREMEYNTIIDDLRRKIVNVTEEWQEKLIEAETMHTVRLSELETIHVNKVSELEMDLARLQDNLHFAEEELQVYGKKNQKLLKDVKRQLEKEMKLSQEVQSKLEVQSSENSQNSQTRINDYLGSSHQMYSTDDQSSLHSSSFNGAVSDGQYPASSISVTDDELRNLLDRLTNVQNEHCEFRRKIETLNSEKSKLIDTIKRQERIILNYIKNRGGGDSGDGSPDSDHRHRPSTSEALTLNGLMSSPVHAKTSLGALLGKVKDTMKGLSGAEILALAGGGDKSSARVTDVDVRQLQRVCEELMMRCLNLETDLQAAVDLNVTLAAQAGPPSVVNTKSPPSHPISSSSSP